MDKGKIILFGLLAIVVLIVAFFLGSLLWAAIIFILKVVLGLIVIAIIGVIGFVVYKAIKK